MAEYNNKHTDFILRHDAGLWVPVRVEIRNIDLVEDVLNLQSERPSEQKFSIVWVNSQETHRNSWKTNETSHVFPWIFGAVRAGLINEALPLAHSRGAIQT